MSDDITKEDEEIIRWASDYTSIPLDKYREMWLRASEKGRNSVRDSVRDFVRDYQDGQTVDDEDAFDRAMRGI